jgi:hypothetical protein
MTVAKTDVTLLDDEIFGRAWYYEKLVIDPPVFEGKVLPVRSEDGRVIGAASLHAAADRVSADVEITDPLAGEFFRDALAGPFAVYKVGRWEATDQIGANGLPVWLACDIDLVSVTLMPIAKEPKS